MEETLIVAHRVGKHYPWNHRNRAAASLSRGFASVKEASGIPSDGPDCDAARKPGL